MPYHRQHNSHYFYFMRETNKLFVQRRSFTWIGGFFLSVSVFAILLSIGMPGVGWIIAAATLVFCSAVTPWLHKRYLVGSWIASVLHLFTFGPLPLQHGGQSSSALPAWWFLTFFVAVPLMLPLPVLLFFKRS